MIAETMALDFGGISIRNDHASTRIISLRRSRKFHFLSGTHFLRDCKILTRRHRLSVVSIRSAAYSEELNPRKPPDDGRGFDAFLSGFEFMSLSSSAAACIYLAVKYGLQSGGSLTLGFFERRGLAVQCVVLVCGLVVGVLIRRRQWDRICGAGDRRAPDFLDRVEKLEEELRNYTRIIQALARQLEKLGIRFRVSRKTLRQPITETAELVHKTTEAVRELSAREDILEKELFEIQKVLLAMQEQQQKQLELILAIGKAGKLLGAPPRPLKNNDEKASREIAATTNSRIP